MNQSLNPADLYFASKSKPSTRRAEAATNAFCSRRAAARCALTLRQLERRGRATGCASHASETRCNEPTTRVQRASNFSGHSGRSHSSDNRVFKTMRKTLFSVLPLLVFLGPAFSRLLLLGGLGLAPATLPAASATESRSTNPAVERVRARIADARRLLEGQPADPSDFVTLAVGDSEGDRVQLLRLAKEDFIRKDAEVSAVSSLGETLKVTVVRPNYVNTAVRVREASGRELQPLAVRYPVEKGGTLTEVAYYTSAHPAVENADVVGAGGEYIHDRLDEAARRLAEKGERISPGVVDVAERLCIVEHTDHKRFLTEDSSSIFKEIQSVYALNNGDAYRYSVSTAGAGGRGQMSPKNQQAIRQQHTTVGLNPHFVESMRDHPNALPAMPLYMQDTSAKPLKKDQVTNALAPGRATQAELLAAGYNSNPVRLPKYLKSGGAGWRSLIPEETKMYLRV